MDAAPLYGEPLVNDPLQAITIVGMGVNGWAVGHLAALAAPVQMQSGGDIQPISIAQASVGQGRNLCQTRMKGRIIGNMHTALIQIQPPTRQAAGCPNQMTGPQLSEYARI